MYNRYIAQSDGSYRKNRIPEQKSNPPPPPEKTEHSSPESPHPPKLHSYPQIGSFLKQLLPASFDTGDLIIVLLLLLMAGDNEENRNNALLTLALYFIM